MTSRKYKMCYDYRRRTSGGVVDAIILSGILLTSLSFILIMIGVC